jgi:gamma-glutamyltranspeptidase / glutathione hydrolase
MTVRTPNGTYEQIDFRETAPAAAYEDMYTNNTDLSIFGGLASGVPGEVRGLHYLHKNYGALTWAEVLQPAIKVAREGWTVNEDLVRYMASANESAQIPDFLSEVPTWAIDFAPNGTLLQLGDTITRKRYGDTLEKIAENGPDEFYTGVMAEAMIAALQAENGTMTMDDLANYSAMVAPAINITYRDKYNIFASDAPSSGAVALSVLKIVDGYSDLFSSSSTLNLSTHRLDEAIRFGYGARADLGDPDFVANLTRYQTEMLSSAYAAETRSKISDFTTFNTSHYDPSGLESLETPGTSHVVTADRTGLAITLTTTVNLLFGSNLMVPETGVIMNNEMNDFSIPGSSNAFGYVPSPANYVRPGKRPLSSITPLIVAHASNNSLYFVIGAAGGSRIITSTIQNVIHVLDEGLTAPEALERPRLHDQLTPNRVTFEYAYDNSTVAFMKQLGHNVTWIAPGQSAAQGIRVLSNGTFEAAGEPRQKNSGGYAV